MTAITGAAQAVANVAPAVRASRGIPLPVLAFGGLIAAAVVGTFAYVGYKLVQGGTSGYPTDEVRRNVFSQYDHSRNGVIELDPSLERQEFIRVESHDGTDDDSMLDDYYTVHDGSAKFVAADANGDATVTADEFEAFIKGYDHDGNDKLKFGELADLERAYPDVEVDRSSTYPDLDYPYVPRTPLPTSPGDQ
jgi:hypothetical protein